MTNRQGYLGLVPKEMLEVEKKKSVQSTLVSQQAPDGDEGDEQQTLEGSSQGEPVEAKDSPADQAMHGLDTKGTNAKLENVTGLFMYENNLRILY